MDIFKKGNEVLGDSIETLKNKIREEVEENIIINENIKNKEIKDLFVINVNNNKLYPNITELIKNIIKNK